MDEAGRGETDSNASAAMSASIMPAYRAGVQRAGVDRAGVSDNGQAPLRPHTELLESLRVSRGDIGDIRDIGDTRYRGAHSSAGLFDIGDGAPLHEASSSAAGPGDVQPGAARPAAPGGAPGSSFAAPPPTRMARNGDTLDGIPSVPHPRSAPVEQRAGPSRLETFVPDGQVAGASPVNGSVPREAMQGHAASRFGVGGFPQGAPADRGSEAPPGGTPGSNPGPQFNVNGRQHASSRLEPTAGFDPDAAYGPSPEAYGPSPDAAYGVGPDAAYFSTPEAAYGSDPHAVGEPQRGPTPPGYVPQPRGSSDSGVPLSREAYERSFVDPTPMPVPDRPSGPPADVPVVGDPPAPAARQAFARNAHPDFAPGRQAPSQADYFDPLDPSVPVESVEASLPHRVPAPPDVPDVDLDGLDDEDEDPTPSDVDGGSLTRIASGLRTDARSAIPDELDVNAVLAAVRQVDGVREAVLRGTPGGVQTLRLELADGADPGRVSRQVARLLKERMGIAAEPRRSEIDSSQRAAMPRAGGVPPSSYGRSAAQHPAGPGANGGDHGAVNYGAASHGAVNHRMSARPPAGHAAASAPARPQPARPASLADASAPTPHPAPAPAFGAAPHGPTSRIVLDRVKVATVGTEATVEVCLAAPTGTYVGTATGPAVDAYLLRLAAQAAGGAIDSLMATSSPAQAPVRCFIDHAGVVPFGSCLVAIVVALVSGDGWVEQLVGSALVAGDPRQAIVRATLAAVNRRLDRFLG